MLRLVAAAFTPLTFDEAYYWTWSKGLAGGYYDHPPMVAFVIRAGTLIAGDTELGVRLVSILLALPMRFAICVGRSPVRRHARGGVRGGAAQRHSDGRGGHADRDAGCAAAGGFELRAVLLAKVLETGRGVWWLAVGAAAGCALLSKYSAMFFGVAIVIWLIAVPKLRHWLRSPWLWLGGVVALALFSPVVLWNADHGWVSFIKQFGRARIEDFRPAFIAELVPTQVGFATPLVFILGAMGLDRWPGAIQAHSPRARWSTVCSGPSSPISSGIRCMRGSRPTGSLRRTAFAVAAAVAANLTPWEGWRRQLANFCRRWAAPSGIVLFVALIAQANTGLLTGYRRDATVRSVGVGWPEIAREIEATRVRVGATCALAPDYGTTSWLMFYLPRWSRSSRSASAGPIWRQPDAALKGRHAMSTMSCPTVGSI